MSNNDYRKPIEILLVEDNPGDVRLTQEALKESKVSNKLMIAHDGLEAWEMLSGEGSQETIPIPDLIFLDLNMPRMDGRELLERLKGDDRFKKIPVVVLTTSQSEEDVLRSYKLHANCYVSKPVGLDDFIEVVRSINRFWLTVVLLPTEVEVEA